MNTGLRWAGLAACLATFACGGHARTPGSEPVAPPSEAPPGEAPTPPPPPPGMTPEKLYTLCEQRVEQPQADGECQADADCATAGCSGEVCTTAGAVADVMTTCEGKLCFTVLDSCGCTDGRCVWSLKDEVPLDAVPIRPPEAGGPAGSLPPTQ